MASTDSLPVPQKNVAYRVVFPILDADGDLVTGATGLDSEVSKDQGTFADCTNEATEIATSSGMYYLDLTSTEMNADCVAIIVKTTSSGAKTTPIVLYPQETGDIKVDVTSFGGTAGTFSGGRPEVNTTHAAGTAWGSGAITAAAIADNAIDLATFAADAKALFGVIAFGTAQAATGTTLQLAAGETFANDEIIGATVFIRSATTGAGQSRVITDYVGATDTATVDTWTTTPTGTITYVVIATAPASTSSPMAVNVTQWLGTACATPTVAGVPEVDITHVGGSTTNVAAMATNVDAILTDTAVIGATGAGLTSLATQASVNTIDDFLDTEVAAILAAVDTEVAAIKTKTDSLTFTVAGQVDANIQSVNDVTVTGNGGTGTEWGP